jgi:site-specific recombinase XerD
MVMTRGKSRRRERMEKDDVELGALIKHFDLHNRTEGKSAKTVAWYKAILEIFHRFLLDGQKPTQLGDLDETRAREFILYLQEKDRWHRTPGIVRRGKLKTISIQGYVRALRTFFNWLHKEGYTEEHRLAKLRPPKAERRVIEALTPEEIARVLGAINPNTDAGARDHAFVILLLDSGLRCSELANATVADINIEGGYLKVMGKGGKERIVPFGATAQKALMRYLLHFRPEPFNPAIQELFLTLEGRPLTYDGARMMFRRIAERSGVERLHAHLCRHTFATNYLINGGDVFTLQQILGHTTLEMVRRYVNLASPHVTLQHRKFSPMDRMDLKKFRPGGTNRTSDSREARAASKWQDKASQAPTMLPEIRVSSARGIAHRYD